MTRSQFNTYILEDLEFIAPQFQYSINPDGSIKAARYDWADRFDQKVESSFSPLQKKGVIKSLSESQTLQPARMHHNAPASYGVDFDVDRIKLALEVLNQSMMSVVIAPTPQEVVRCQGQLATCFTRHTHAFMVDQMMKTADLQQTILKGCLPPSVSSALSCEV
jgi:hypothetical protein